MSASCNKCGGRMRGVDYGLVPLAVCQSCGREVPWFEDVEEPVVKKIAEKFWNEPAVAIGAATSVLVGVVLFRDGVSVSEVVPVLGPLVSSLGIRGLVTPLTPGGKP